MIAGDATRERVRQVWRDIHEAVYYAANVTGCAQYTDIADLRARRSDLGGDLDALRCIERGGRLVSADVQQYERLHADFTDLMRWAGDEPSPKAVEQFTTEVYGLETRVWAIVPTEHLPSGMIAQVVDDSNGKARTVRRVRRTGKLLD